MSKIEQLRESVKKHGYDPAIQCPWCGGDNIVVKSGSRWCEEHTDWEDAVRRMRCRPCAYDWTVIHP